MSNQIKERKFGSLTASCYKSVIKLYRLNWKKHTIHQACTQRLLILLSSCFHRGWHTNYLKWELQYHRGQYKRNQCYLGNEVVSEFNITVHSMGYARGSQVNVSLDLMHHSIHVGHAGPVLHAGAPVSANHTVDLFLDLSW